MGTSSLWKIHAANAASALVFSNISEKCSTLPAPLEAMTGMVPSQLTIFKVYSPESSPISRKEHISLSFGLFVVPLFGF